LDPYWFKLLIRFCVGGLWVTLTTIVADRFGSKLGGWIGGLPSTIVVTLFFAGDYQDPSGQRGARNPNLCSRR
jgi:hypothetical protein